MSGKYRICLVIKLDEQYDLVDNIMQLMDEIKKKHSSNIPFNVNICWLVGQQGPN